MRNFDLPLIDQVKLLYDALSDPKTRTTKSYARDKDDNSVLDYDPTAVKFCAVGWMRKLDLDKIGIYKIYGSRSIMQDNDLNVKIVLNTLKIRMKSY